MEKDISTFYSVELNKVLSFMTLEMLDDYPTVNINLDYLFLSILLQKENLASKMLNGILLSNDIDSIIDEISSKISSKSLRILHPRRKIKFTDDLKKVLDLSLNKRNLFPKQEYITTEHVLLALCEYKSNISDILKHYGIDYDLVYEKIKLEQEEIDNYKIEEGEDLYPIKFIGGSSDDSEQYSNSKSIQRVKLPLMSNVNKNNRNGGKSFLSSYTIDITKQAESKLIDPIIGREHELKQIFNVLGRRNKNNAVLVGQGGVGKTSIVRYIAHLIVNNLCPSKFFNKRLLQLDMPSIIAGTNFRGMFEERLKGLIEEAKKSGNVILFIDDLHSVINDKQQIGDVNITSILSSTLSEGAIQVIGCTNFKDYKNAIESNTSLNRKFQKIVIEPSTINESIDILNGCKSLYENFHKVTYTDKAIESCVKLASRYISDRCLPDSAIDLMDEAASSVILSKKEPSTIKNYKMSLMKLKEDKEKAIRNDDFSEVDKIVLEENKLKVQLSEYKNKEEKSKESTIVDDTNIYELVAEKTSIPISKISTNEKSNLLHINDILKQSVIGQDEAIDKICRVIKRNRIGLANKNKPAVFLLCGSTGCGKSLVAKQLATEIFGDEKYLVRLDMSEYADKGSITRLVGAPPSYIGYNDANSLADTIRNKKYCVLLLDEIEKADESVFNTFLQVFDDGRLTDGTGNIVDFKNTIIMMTSNIGSKKAMDFGNNIGLTTEKDLSSLNSEKSFSIIQKELKHKFQPEFLNRIDEVVFFNKLTPVNIKLIIELELKKAEKSLEDIGYGFDESFYSKETVEYLYSLIKDDSNNGARPVIRTIQTNVIDVITELILSNDYKSGYKFKANVKDEKLFIE